MVHLYRVLLRITEFYDDLSISLSITGGCYQADMTELLSDITSYVMETFVKSSMSAVLCRELCRERGYNITLLQTTDCMCLIDTTTTMIGYVLFTRGGMGTSYV